MFDIKETIISKFVFRLGGLGGGDGRGGEEGGPEDNQYIHPSHVQEIEVQCLAAYLFPQTTIKSQQPHPYPCPSHRKRILDPKR